MTAFETQALAPGDIVACGKHVGTVVSLAMYTVRIEWKPGQPTIHERDQMDKISPASLKRSARYKPSAKDGQCIICDRGSGLVVCDRCKENVNQP